MEYRHGRDMERAYQVGFEETCDSLAVFLSVICLSFVMSVVCVSVDCQSIIMTHALLVGPIWLMFCWLVFLHYRMLMACI